MLSVSVLSELINESTPTRVAASLDAAATSVGSCAT